MKKWLLITVALVTSTPVWAEEDEQLRQQLLSVPESGLNQQLAAAMYQTMPSTKTRSARSKVQPAAALLRADFGPLFYQQFFRVKVNNAKAASLPWRSGT